MLTGLAASRVSAVGELLRPRLTSVRIELPTPRDVAALVDRLIREPRTWPAVRAAGRARRAGRCNCRRPDRCARAGHHRLCPPERRS
ncbi:hypothetical protein DMA15_29070 [Streptomyces sp. WAC 01529]|nr:hypothetical protein DMA15_29070 [Streptomyces sp. WAC 01529]